MLTTSEYKSIKKDFPKFNLQIIPKKFLWLKELKTLFQGHS